MLLCLCYSHNQFIVLNLGLPSVHTKNYGTCFSLSLLLWISPHALNPRRPISQFLWEDKWLSLRVLGAHPTIIVTALILLWGRLEYRKIKQSRETSPKHTGMSLPHPLIRESMSFGDLCPHLLHSSRIWVAIGPGWETAVQVVLWVLVALFNVLALIYFQNPQIVAFFVFCCRGFICNYQES